MHIAYLAGIIDGEGSIMLPRTGATKLNGLWTSYSVKVAIASTDLRLLSAIQFQYDGVIEKATTSKHVDCTNHKEGYRVRWFAANAIEIIELVRPHLVIKGEQADLALEFYRLQQGNYRARKTLEEVVAYDEIAKKIKALNKRGVI